MTEQTNCHICKRLIFTPIDIGDGIPRCVYCTADYFLANPDKPIKIYKTCHEKRYVTFGFDHQHNINDQHFDHNCIAIVHGDRSTVFELFGSRFCFEYTEESWLKKPDRMKYFRRGYITANKPEEGEKE